MERSNLHKLLNLLTENKAKIYIAFWFLVILFVLGYILYINWQLDWLSIVNNLLSEIAGILITLYFVEAIINRQEKKRKINLEFQALIVVNKYIINSLTTVLGMIGLEDKMKKDYSFINIKGRTDSDLGIYMIKLDDELVNKRYDWGESSAYQRSIDSYKGKIFNGMTEDLDFSLLEKNIREGKYILDILQSGLDFDSIEMLLVSISKLEKIIENRSVINLFHKQNWKKAVQEKEIEMGSLIVSLEIVAGDFSDAINSLYVLQKIAFKNTEIK